MKKAYLLTMISLLFITSCSKSNTSSNPSNFKSDNISSDNSNTSSSKTNLEILKSFLDEASNNYSMKCTVDEYTNYYGVKTTSKNYMDIASKDDYFSITKYSQVFDGIGNIDRNTIDSDIRFKSIEYEGEKVVSSSYLNMSNEICYTVHKDSYGYTTPWDTSFKSFFDDLKVTDFDSDDEITYKLNISNLSDDLSNQILYQLGCLSVSSLTSLHIDSVYLIKENNSFSKMNFTFVDDEDESVYTKYTISADIDINSAESDVKVEEVVSGEKIEELDSAFKSLSGYNFDFNLKVTISRTERKEYETSATSDGEKIVSSRFMYVQSEDGLDYYRSLTDSDKAYKTMNRISGLTLKDVLPSFDISTYFFTKAANKTYILSNKAKRCEVSSKDLLVYQPFGLTFSSLTIKLGEDSLSMTGINGSYQFDASYTNINKVSTISFTEESTLGYGDYLESYSWSYSDYIDTFTAQLNASDKEETYSILNNIPTFYSYITTSLPSFVFSFSLLGIEYEYSNTSDRDTDYINLISFYKENGFIVATSQTGVTILTKKFTIGDEEKTLSLNVMSGKAYAIPIIGVFPTISN